MSNTSTNINIRMDKELKKQFETFCESVGMTMSAAFNVFAKKTCWNEQSSYIYRSCK